MNTDPQPCLSSQFLPHFSFQWHSALACVLLTLPTGSPRWPCGPGECPESSGGRQPGRGYLEGSCLLLSFLLKHKVDNQKPCSRSVGVSVGDLSHFGTVWIRILAWIRTLVLRIRIWLFSSATSKMPSKNIIFSNFFCFLCSVDTFTSVLQRKKSLN
jgi:hypothetical protein